MAEQKKLSLKMAQIADFAQKAQQDPTASSIDRRLALLVEQLAARVVERDGKVASLESDVKAARDEVATLRGKFDQLLQVVQGFEAEVLRIVEAAGADVGDEPAAAKPGKPAAAKPGKPAAPPSKPPPRPRMTKPPAPPPPSAKPASEPAAPAAPAATNGAGAAS
jgi:hypothetical protein